MGRVSRPAQWALNHPAVYDCGQVLAGIHWVEKRIANHLPKNREGPLRVLDMGGGTARDRRLWPQMTTYHCLDVDMARLAAARRRGSEILAMQSDATRAGVRAGTFDVVVCKAVSHHLDETSLPLLFAECARVMKPDGRLIFLDPLSTDRNLPGRALWAIDRGAHPRTENELIHAIGEQFSIVAHDRFRVLHDYLLCVGAREDADPHRSSLGANG